MVSSSLSFISALAFPLSSPKTAPYHATTFPSFVPAPSNPGAALRRRRNGGGHKTLAVGGDPLGEFGARDPFQAEIETNFCEKVGNMDTEHLILIPKLSALSLAQRSCDPIPASQPPMSKEDAGKLLKKIVGWRLVEADGGTKLQCLWKVRDYGCGVELINRIYKATKIVGHYPDLHLEQPNQIRAELWTASIGGLSLNDFIIAAKIDQIEALDLLPKRRIWA